MTTSLNTAPRLRGRPREFDMNEALDKALAVFSERGFQAASIGELTDAMSLASGSVYKAFKDKRGIFLAALRRYRDVRRALLGDAVAAGGTGREKVLAVLGFYAASSSDADGRKGCLIVGSATELALFDGEVASHIAMSFDGSEHLLAALIGEGQRDGSIPPHIDAAATARTLLCLMMGMRVIGKTGRTRDQMAAVAESADKLLS